MRVERVDGTAERRVVTAFIVNTEALAKAAAKLEKDSFRSKWANWVAGWCVKHFKAHGTAPAAAIEAHFEEWCQTPQDEETKTLVQRFLSSLSADYEALAEDLQTSHVLKLAENYINDVRAERLKNTIETCYQRGDRDSALEAIQTFRKINFSQADFVDLFSDKEAQRKALEYKQRVLIKYKSGAGEFFDDTLAEDTFLGMIGLPKGMKSFLMLDIAWNGVLQGKRVAYFQIGDMTENQVMGRFIARASRRPLEAKLLLWPVRLVPAVDTICQVDSRDITYENALTTEEGQAAFERYNKESKFRLSYHPTMTISASGIRAMLATWDKQGWSAEVCVIDYADNLAPDDKKLPYYDQISEKWAILRQISEVRKCFVVTGTQVNKEGFKNPWVFTRNNFSGSKMILAHCSHMLGINMTDEEKSKQVFRLNWIVRRNGAFTETRCMTAVACLDVAQAIVLSHF